ncbi:hypothetical protein NSQ96_18135 [Caldifermentibacillus hisashii]|uniref:hypothetical protein n=1 Tax=Caldifermentibacillus hisashii TaxID=996558 RepID=UPI0031FBB078
MTTSLVLVAIFGWELLNFDDETLSRHHFAVKNARFWRRDLFSSPSWAEKSTTLPTSVVCFALQNKLP